MTKGFGQRYQVIPRVMCLIYYQDEVLLIKGSKAKDWAGSLNGVGGHIEKGEGVIEAAEREIEEETGLKVKNTKLKGVVHVDDFFEKQIMMFVTTSQAQTKEVVANEEGELVWVKRQQISNHKVMEDLEEIMRGVDQLRPGEMLEGVSRYDEGKLTKLKLRVV